MPTPRKGEEQKAYISRCMGSSEMNSEFPDSSQRAAVCHTYWRNWKKHGSIKGASSHSMNFSELRGAEIFSVGTWNDITFTESDLVGIADSFNQLALSGRVPLKFGHNDEQPLTDGQPALGWVERVWVEGNKLLADFVNVPEVVYNAIRDKLYNFVSVELLEEAARDGKVFPWVLSGIALLGSDLPAVSNLQELSKLTMSRRACRQFNKAGLLTFTGDSTRMADDDTKALRDRLADMEAKLAKFTDENKALAAERDEAIKLRKQEKAKAIKEQVEAKFEDAIERKVLLPKSREAYFKWQFPSDDVDKLINEFDMKDVDNFIEENKVQMSSNAGKPRQAADDEEGKTPDVVLTQRTKRFMTENRVTDYKFAMMQVLGEDPELAEAYRMMPDTLYK